MRLLFGGTQIGDTNAVRIDPSRELMRNPAGVGYRWKYTYGITGSITVSSPSDCTSKMNAITAALSGAAGDLKFQYDDASDTPNSVVSSTTFTGVRCTGGPTWLSQPGGQFATWRAFSAQFEWESELGSGLPALLDFDETVLISNPPEQYAGLEAVNGADPAFFPTIEKPISRATQRGFAVGRAAYPDPATVAPLLFTPNGTTIVLKTYDITKVAKKPRYTGAGTNYDNYRIEWSYSFESTAALVATPNAWTGL